MCEVPLVDLKHYRMKLSKIIVYQSLPKPLDNTLTHSNYRRGYKHFSNIHLYLIYNFDVKYCVMFIMNTELDRILEGRKWLFDNYINMDGWTDRPVLKRKFRAK